MRGLGVTSLVVGAPLVIVNEFDPVNRTGGTLTPDNTSVTATTTSDRYFLARASAVGEYVEFRWNGQGHSNHSWGLAPLSPTGPVWNSSWVNTNGFVPNGVPRVIGMKRDASNLTVWLDNAAGILLPLPVPGAVLHWAMSAANMSSSACAQYRVLQPPEFTYPSR